MVLAGNTYDVEYLTNGTCPQQSVESVYVNASDDAIFCFDRLLCRYSKFGFCNCYFRWDHSHLIHFQLEGSQLMLYTGEITGGVAGYYLQC